MDSDITHELESRLRNIEAHLGIGHTDETTGAYTVDTHESLVPPEPDQPTAGSAPVTLSQADYQALLDRANAAPAEPAEPEPEPEA